MPEEARGFGFPELELQVVINFLIQVLGIKCGPSAIVVFALYCGAKSSGNLLQTFWVLFLIESETDPRTLRLACLESSVSPLPQ